MPSPSSSRSSRSPCVLRAHRFGRRVLCYTVTLFDLVTLHVYTFFFKYGVIPGICIIARNISLAFFIIFTCWENSTKKIGLDAWLGTRAFIAMIKTKCIKIITATRLNERQDVLCYDFQSLLAVNLEERKQLSPSFISRNHVIKLTLNHQCHFNPHLNILSISRNSRTFYWRSCDILLMKWKNSKHFSLTYIKINEKILSESLLKNRIRTFIKHFRSCSTVNILKGKFDYSQ